MKRRLFIMALMLSLLTGLAIGQWNLGAPGDWLSVGPIYRIGPYYYPNSDLPIEPQMFLADYPSYPPIYYPGYYPTYPYFDSYPLGTFGLRSGGNWPYLRITPVTQTFRM